MAKRWRIRHKLLLGLGLVLGTIGLLLTGTVQGLLSHVQTMRLFDSKLAELDDAEEFQRAVGLLRARMEAPTTIDEEEAILRQRMEFAREKVAAYERRLDDSIERGRDSDRGAHEKARLMSVQTAFAQFDKGLSTNKHPTLVGEGDSKRLFDEPLVVASAQKLNELAVEIRSSILDEQFRRIASSKRHANFCGCSLSTPVPAGK